MKDMYKPTFGEPITSWVKWFAWRPVSTADYGIVWLRTIYRRRIQKHDFLPGGIEHWWQYVVAPVGSKDNG